MAERCREADVCKEGGCDRSAKGRQRIQAFHIHTPFRMTLSFDLDRLRKLSSACHCALFLRYSLRLRLSDNSGVEVNQSEKPNIG
jgi:hypothetical protein